MSGHKAHQSQTPMHGHGPYCGHLIVEHEGHRDYLHNGKLDHVHERGVDTHTLGINEKNPVRCTPAHSCGGHDIEHKHGPNCGHAAVPHGDHVDYLVDGHLHHPCDHHCDDHGALTVFA